MVLDLLAATWAAGIPPRSAVASIATAVEDPWAQSLNAVVERLDLGAAPERAFADLLALFPSDDGPYAPVASAVALLVDSTTTGSSPAEGLARTASRLRKARHRRGEAAARSAAVRVAAPLGLCFLPAFILLGIVPTVLGALGPALG
jgi:Flp pilus assembly protein TadB